MTTADTTATNEIGRNIERDWRGQTWSNATHASVTDPDARLYRKAKGRPAQLCYMGHALTENRNGFVVEATLTHADGTAERRAAIDMLDALDPGSTRRITLGADKGYDAAEFVETLRDDVRDAAHRGEGERLGHRRSHHAARRLRSEPAEAKACRGAVRLGQDGRADPQDHAARGEARLRPVHADHGRLQSRQAAKAPGCLTAGEAAANPMPSLHQPTSRGYGSISPAFSAAC